MLDSVGCGELPDAGAYGDEGSNTLGNIAREIKLRIPHLRSLGLGRVVDIGDGDGGEPRAAFGRMAESSAGKDSVTGHWEMMGIVLDHPFATFPHGFPPEIINKFEERIGRRTIGNVVASGTEIIERLGAEHVRTGSPIVYTSADSVFQIAAHEDVIPVADLYRMCEIASEIVAPLNVGRVIARTFVGSDGAFIRTANRHDYALTPPADTLLDLLGSRRSMVIAAGGGLVTAPETYALLLRHATTVWLKARPEDYWQRVIRQGDRRPIDQHPHARDALRQLVARREALYTRAHVTVDTAGLSVAQVAQKVERAVARG